MKIKQTLIVSVFTIGLGVLLGSPTVSAASCAGVQTSIVSCTETGTVTCKIVSHDPSTGKPLKTKEGAVITTDEAPVNNKCSDGSTPVTVDNNGVWGILKLVINIMTAGIGVLAVAGIVYGSILYTSAGGSAEQTKKAMGIITNVVIGILAYALMYAVLNFLIPGGLFG